MHWITSHWTQIAAVAAVLALYWLSTWIARSPALRASGIVTALGDVLLYLVAPVPVVGPLLSRVLIALALASRPDGAEPVPLRATGPLLMLLAAGLTLPACAPGWQQRTADRIDCYGPLVDRAVGLILDAAHDPARALVGAVELYREIRATLGEPDVRTCALHRLEAERAPASAGGEKMGGEEERLRALVCAGLEAEEGRR